MRTEVELRRLFNETFDQLPEEARHQIIKFWVEHDVPYDGDRFQPQIFKLEEIDKTQKLGAQTDGVTFTFEKFMADESPQNILKCVIAHELAHVYRMAEYHQPGCEEQSKCLEEKRVEEICNEWGFSHREVRQWITDNKDKLGITE